MSKKNSSAYAFSFFLFISLTLALSIPTFADAPKVESETNKIAKDEDSHENEAVAQAPDPEPVPPPKEKIPDNFLSMGEGDYFSRYALLVDKSTRTLSIWSNEKEIPKLVTIYSADLGKKPGDKLVRGDEKTPEGVYFFEESLEAASLNFQEYGQRAFTMDYPNLFDRRQRKTGSGIWLHAIPETKSLLRGSRGCIVVRNNVINEIGKYIDLKNTPIVVSDKVNYLTKEEFTSSRKKWTEWLSNWRKSWESKELDAYISHYDEEFRSQGMNKSRWKKFKQSLAERYNYIKVKIRQPIILKHKDQLVIKFLQGYQSDQITDFGEKHLFLRETEAGTKIIAEEWQPVNGAYMRNAESKLSAETHWDN